MASRNTYERRLQNAAMVSGGATSTACSSALIATRFLKCANLEQDGYKPSSIPYEQRTKTRISGTCSGSQTTSRWA
eukprot:792331-Rhodomonas_salina.1